MRPCTPYFTDHNDNHCIVAYLSSSLDLKFKKKNIGLKLQPTSPYSGVVGAEADVVIARIVYGFHTEPQPVGGRPDRPAYCTISAIRH